MSLFKEFRDFAIKGNVVDLATGVIIGAAFGAIVSSLVDDVFMPLIGLVLGRLDFSNLFVVVSIRTTSQSRLSPLRGPPGWPPLISVCSSMQL